MEKGAHDRDILSRFDQILSKHLDRLIGTNVGLNGLPLNLFTVSAIVLLVERENEIKNLGLPREKRYSRQSIVNDLAEIGLDFTDELHGIIDDLIKKGYAKEDENGYLITQKPALSIAQLLDLLFQGMPGMNLVAYMIQLYREVTGGQKDIATAETSMDQTLTQQGVIPSGKKANQKHQQASQKLIDQETRIRRLASASGQQKIQSGSHKINIDELKIRLDRLRGKKAGGPKIVTASGEVRHLTVPKAEEHQEKSLKKPPATEKKPTSTPQNEKTAKKDVSDAQHAASINDDQEQKAKDAPAKATQPEEQATKEAPSNDLEPRPNYGEPMGESLAPQPETTDDSAAVQATGPKDKGQDNSISDEKPLEEMELPADSGKETISPEPDVLPPEIDDDEIEKKISSFKESVSLKCPSCDTGTISPRKTSTGKEFYVCNNPECNFISWGKPRYTPCPRCKNPFMIEVRDDADDIILECVNSACGYRKASAESRQKDPKSKGRKPRKRVVRKRLVRRKKK